jgi:hypothetical protein
LTETLMEGDREGEGAPGLADRLALPSEEVNVAVLPLAADEAGVDDAVGSCEARGVLVEVACAALRHEGVHEEVELNCAVVRWESGGEEGEVVVENLDQFAAVGEPAQAQLLLQVRVQIVAVARMHKEFVHVAPASVRVLLDVESGLEGGIHRKLAQG